MAGTMVPPAAAGRLTLGARNQPVSASYVNSFRVTTVAERLAFHMRQGYQSDCNEFFNLCLSLARGIDFAVANNERLQTANDLPSILKQVCQRKNDLILQAAVMVLMISAKNACKIGWFKEKDTEELFALADEVGRSFCNPGDITTLTSDYFSTMSTIMSRFYPLIKMGNILASLVVKPGYGTYIIDFNISKITKSSPQDKIRLFVAQTDNIETSSCIISPQQVNFLLNGKGVEKRTSVLMDTGPQTPTNVTAMLKYGTNLLQAVGQFNGHYIIAVAFMSMTTLKDAPSLPDYVQPSAASLDPDSDLIEGASRISLNCPISYSHIRIPVKGHSCKHHQCFDFSNFVDINTRRPSWRCPHCNQHICYTDIRVDQSMVKVLRDVGESVTDVMISVDGSWRAVLEDDENAQKKLEKSLNTQKGMSEQRESATSSSVVPMVLDLTEADDLMDTVEITDIEDTKPFPPHIADEFWSSVLNSGSLVNVGLDVQMDSGNSELNFTNTTTSPVLTDAISPALNQAVDRGTNLASATQLPNANEYGRLLQLHANEYGRLLQLHRNLGNIHRNPVAVQALPAVSQGLVPQQRSRAISNTVVSQGYSSGASAALGLNTNWNHQDRLFVPGQSTQQHAFGPASSNPSQVAYGPSGLRADSQNLHQQQSFRVPHPMTQSPSVSQSPSPLPQTLPQQGVALAHVGVGNTLGTLSSQQGRYMNTAQRAVLMGRQLPSVPGQIQTSRPGASNLVNPNGIRIPAVDSRRNIGGAVQATSVTDAPLDLSSEQNWRPTGRMRGSLQGQAYSDALRGLMAQPNQQAPVPRPTNLASPATRTVELQAILSNMRNAPAPPVQNTPDPPVQNTQTTQAASFGGNNP